MLNFNPISAQRINTPEITSRFHENMKYICRFLEMRKTATPIHIDLTDKPENGILIDISGDDISSLNSVRDDHESSDARMISGNERVKPSEWGTMIHHNDKLIGVYFVRMGLRGPIKIGYSDREIKERIEKGKTFNPWMNILYIMSCSHLEHRQLERELHYVFWRRRIHVDGKATEWFNIAKKDLHTLFYNRQFYKSIRQVTSHASEYISEDCTFVESSQQLDPEYQDKYANRPVFSRPCKRPQRFIC